MAMIPVSSWGRLDASLHQAVPLTDRFRAGSRIAETPGGVAHGNGRSYGDVCLNPGGILWMTAGMDRFMDFNAESGRLVCESGVMLRDILRTFIPRGWTLPVTPGTQLITVGGAIANDVHGKNHHRLGSFGDHVTWLRLARTDGSVVECGPGLLKDWFRATVGGLGLTGVILEVELQLRPVQGPWMDAETLPYGNLKEFFELADSSEAMWEHTVSWIDCISGGGRGRGIFMRANPAPAQNRPEPAAHRRGVPFTPPISLVNPLSLRPFNMLYFNLQKLKAGRSLVHYEPFSYPLDNLLNWNRIYGPRGFYQYQSVVPRGQGAEVVSALLAEISRSGAGSFLAVLKTFGNRESVGMLSFPRPGVTLALDFPNHGERTLKLFQRLDAIVSEAGGRLYPAKDARMPAEMFCAGYPRLDEFLGYRDPHISSALSRRLLGN